MIELPFTFLIKAVVPIVSFAIGCVIGAFVWWKLKKPWPPNFDRLAEEIGLLEDELPKTNSAVELIRTKAGYFDNFDRASLYVSDSVEPEDVLTRRLQVAKTRLICYRRDLESVASFLGPSQRRDHGASKSAQPKRQEEPASQFAREETTEETISEYTPIEVDIRIEPKDERFDGASTPQEIVGFYNRAVTDSVASARFRERYQPLRIGTINAVERRQNPTIEEEFRETTDGDFFAIPIKGNETHAVVPRLGLTIEAVSLNAGALAKVFGVSEFDSKGYYSRYTVKTPAIFRKEGERWVLDKPGEMDLGLGHSA